jgi:UDP-glucose 4-epimerase
MAGLADPRVLADFDAVLHLAWSSVPSTSENDPGIEEREDLPFARLLVSAAEACAKRPRLYFFSTAAVYGNTGDEPVDENRKCRPLGRYAAAKLEAEKIVLRAPGNTVLRITNVFGAGCTPRKTQGVIPAFVEACLSGEAVTVWGDGSATKDYIASDDLYAAVGALLGGDASGAFNVASGHVFSVNEIIAIVSLAAGRTVSVEHAPRFAWDVQKAHVSSGRLRSATGWAPLVDPATAIRRLVRA